MNRRSFFAIAARYRGSILDDRVIDVLLLPVHAAEAVMAFRIVGVELDGAGLVTDRVFVAVELRRIRRHPVVELTRALRVDGDELLEHGNRVEQLVLLDEDAL
jgi:hypothetical protein